MYLLIVPNQLLVDTLYIVDKVTIDSSSFIQAIILALFVTPLAIIFGYFAKNANKYRITGKEIF